LPLAWALPGARCGGGSRAGSADPNSRDGRVGISEGRVQATGTVLLAEHVVITATSGNLRSICPDCGNLMHRRTSLAQLDEFRSILAVTVVQRSPHITDGPQLSTNDHLEGARQTCGNSTPKTSEPSTDISTGRLKPANSRQRWMGALTAYI
jgi:hypothetical protein